jgi:DNA-binding transcriptional ArsR family regulator
MGDTVQIDRDTIKALGSETRLEILRRLGERQMTESEVSRSIGKHVTTVAQHMRVLERRNLVERMERPGRKWIYYKLSSSGKRIVHPSDHGFVFGLLGSLGMIVTGAAFSMAQMRGQFSAQMADQAAGAMVEKSSELAMAVQAEPQPDYSFLVPAALVVAGVAVMAFVLYRRHARR